jgi:segregation and condensation protein B
MIDFDLPMEKENRELFSNTELANTKTKDFVELSLEELLDGATHEDKRDLLEALIFASPEPLGIEKINGILDWNENKISNTISALNEEYSQNGRSFEIRRLAGGWQLVSRRRYSSILRKLLKARVKSKLSQAALETLSVTAYKQPLTKTEIEAVRGVKADGVLRTLLDRRLVTIAGRSNAVGRPLLYRTTREFLEYFGLDSLNDLPRLKEIRNMVKGGEDSADENLPPHKLTPVVPDEDESKINHCIDDHELHDSSSDDKNNDRNGADL